MALFEYRILFLSMDQVEIYQNDVVFVRNPAKQIVAQLLFTNDKDAKAFADLLLSVRASSSRNSNGIR
jgi:hypothetical protein